MTPRPTLAVLVDLSGTLHVGGKPIPGAVEALKRLRALPNVGALRFVTNTTQESRASLLRTLGNAGFQVGEEELHTSLSASRQLVGAPRAQALGAAH